jgi:NAD(P)-dependent dehydrogenase (short-subunit alcohol dehydrogenase family)
MQFLRGRTAIITGASAGIGAATARVFVAAGANVTVMARNKVALDSLAASLGAQVLVHIGDVSVWEDVSDMVTTTLDRFGRVDVLINNAATIDPIARLATADPADWTRAVAVNLSSVFYGMRAVLPVMRAQGGGTILTVSSGAAHHALEGWSAYCASKAGAAMLTQSAHLEEAGRGLRVMGLSPGTVATDMQVKIRASGINPVSQLDPGAHIPTEWVAQCLAWMCGPKADAHLGQEISLRSDDIRRAVGLIG